MATEDDDFLNIGLMNGNDIAKLVGNKVDENEPVESKEPEKPEQPEEIQEEPEPSEKNKAASDSSSLAELFQEAGFFKTIDKEKLGSIKSVEDFSNLIDEEIENRYNQNADEKTKRINEFMGYNARPDVVSQYEDNIATFESIKNEQIEEEDNEQSINLRKNLLTMYYGSKGLDDDEVEDMVQRSIESGNEIRDAKKAKDALLKLYKDSYEDYKKQLKQQKEKQIKDIEEQNKSFESSVINDDELFDKFNINKQTRQKIVDAVVKADNSGKSEIQRYAAKDPKSFYKYVGMAYVLTDGFKDISKLFSGAVNKQVNKKINALESLINNSSIRKDGSLEFKSGLSEKMPSIDLSGLQLDDE